MKYISISCRWLFKKWKADDMFSGFLIGGGSSFCTKTFVMYADLLHK